MKYYERESIYNIRNKNIRGNFKRQSHIQAILLKLCRKAIRKSDVDLIIDTNSQLKVSE